ncbi:hypothetical protein, partial [Pseudomonas amygdali]
MTLMDIWIAFNNSGLKPASPGQAGCRGSEGQALEAISCMWLVSFFK